MRWLLALSVILAGCTLGGRIHDVRLSNRERHPSELLAPHAGPWTGGPIAP